MEKDGKTEKIRVMVVGLPGEMATLFANHIEETEDMKLVPFALSGKEGRLKIGQTEIWQIGPEWHEKRLIEINPDIVVDFISSQKTLEQNAGLYCRCNTPFVMSALPEDRKLVYRLVKQSNISAVFVAAGTRIPVIFKAVRFLADRKGEKGAVFYM